jgi:hypothetical protein
MKGWRAASWGLGPIMLVETEQIIYQQICW